MTIFGTLEEFEDMRDFIRGQMFTNKCMCGEVSVGFTNITGITTCA